MDLSKHISLKPVATHIFGSIIDGTEFSHLLFRWTSEEGKGEYANMYSITDALKKGSRRGLLSSAHWTSQEGGEYVDYRPGYLPHSLLKKMNMGVSGLAAGLDIAMNAYLEGEGTTALWEWDIENPPQHVDDVWGFRFRGKLTPEIVEQLNSRLGDLFNKFDEVTRVKWNKKWLVQNRHGLFEFHQESSKHPLRVMHCEDSTRVGEVEIQRDLFKVLWTLKEGRQNIMRHFFVSQEKQGVLNPLKSLQLILDGLDRHLEVS